MMRSSNPTLSNSIFQSTVNTGSGSMTIQGTVNKTAFLLLCVVGAASWTWNDAILGSVKTPFIAIGAIGGFIFALITMFKKHWAPITAPIYAILEGLFLGAFSSILEQQYPGIVMQAVGLTFATLFCLLGAYKSGMIKVTENFKLGIAAATGGIFVFYLVSMVLSFFGVNMGFVFGNGIFGVGFSLVVVTIAALNLVMDFDFIENAAESGAPKYMEWYGAFGLIVTLIWLYLEIIRLLVKLRSRD